MGDKLKQMISNVRLTEGRTGMNRLAVATGKSERMIDRYLKGQSMPHPDTAYEIALACGFSKAAALALARECEQARAKTA